MQSKNTHNFASSRQQTFFVSDVFKGCAYRRLLSILSEISSSLGCDPSRVLAA